MLTSKDLCLRSAKSHPETAEAALHNQKEK